MLRRMTLRSDSRRARREILDGLREIEDGGDPAVSISGLARRLGIPQSTAHYHVAWLRKHGLVTTGAGRSARVRLTPAGRIATDC